jgi:hypothetical protein
MIKRLLRFAARTPPPPRPPLRPPSPPGLAKSSPPKPAASAKPSAFAAPGIVGRWQAPDSNDTTEFRADGSLAEQLATGETINGRYSLEGSKLRVQLDGVGELSFAAAVTAETLELTDAEGQVTRYRRTK